MEFNLYFSSRNNNDKSTSRDKRELVRSKRIQYLDQRSLGSRLKEKRFASRSYCLSISDMEALGIIMIKAHQEIREN